MSENLSDPNNSNNGGMMAGLVMVILAVIVAGGYYYYTNSMAPADAPEQAEMASASGEEVDMANAAEDGDVEVPPFEGSDVKPGNPVVAKVGSSEITRLDVFEFVQQMPPQMQQLPPQQVYPVALEQVINNRLIQSEADKQDYESSEAFKQQVEQAKENIARTLYLQEKMAAAITEDKVNALYKEKVKEIPDVEERSARHILVESEDEAKKIIEDLKGGADFAEMAKEHSKGPTGEKGGDLGWFAQAEMVPEFSSVAFSAKPGALVEEPVKTQFGYHVIKVGESRTRAKPTMEQMQNLLMAEIQREELLKMISELRGKQEIIVYDVNGNVPGTEPSAGDEDVEAEPAPAPAEKQAAPDAAPEAAE